MLDEGFRRKDPATGIADQVFDAAAIAGEHGHAVRQRIGNDQRLRFMFVERRKEEDVDLAVERVQQQSVIDQPPTGKVGSEHRLPRTRGLNSSSTPARDAARFSSQSPAIAASSAPTAQASAGMVSSLAKPQLGQVIVDRSVIGGSSKHAAGIGRDGLVIAPRASFQARSYGHGLSGSVLTSPPLRNSF